MKDILSGIRKWWFRTENVICVSSSVSFAHLCVNVKLLDYGLRFEFTLPGILNRLNPFYYFCRGCVWLLRKVTKNSFSSVWWHFGSYKALELQIMESSNLFAFKYCWNMHCDHWGHQLECGLAGIEFLAIFYDSRHWNDGELVPCCGPSAKSSTASGEGGN